MISRLLILLFLLLSPILVFAFPDTERIPEAPSTLTEPPLDILNDQPDALVVTSDNRYVFFAIGNQIQRMDLASWELTGDQIPALSGTADVEGDPDEGGNVMGLAVFGSQLFAVQDDGDLLIFNLDDLSEDPLLFRISDGELGDVVADPEGFADEDQLYIADVVNKQVLVYDISQDEVEGTIDLRNNLGASVDPVDLEFAAVPNGADKIYVSTNEGILFSIVEGSFTTSRIESLGTEGNDLVALGASPDGDFLLIVDQTDSLIHILDTSTDTSVNPIYTPIDLADINSSPRDVVVTDVSNPDDTYAYIAGPNGLTVLDLDINNGSFDDVDILDLGTTEEDEEPLPISGSSPNLIFAISNEYLLTVNGNADISVITENPFVTITADSLGGSALTTGGDFTITFEADRAGTYSVRLGGGLNADGIEVDSGDVTDANTSVTTASISHSSDFVEGDNEIFIFVTDAEGNRGRDMTIITVDTPPPILVLNSTGFGDGRVFLNFNRLDIADIDHYNLYVATDAATVLSKTDVDATVNQPSSGSTVEGTIEGLTNGVTYYIAAEAVDAAGNVGPRNGILDNGLVATAIPQATIGITGLAGETGCQLNQLGMDRGNEVVWVLFLLMLICLFVARYRFYVPGRISDVPGPEPTLPRGRSQVPDQMSKTLRLIRPLSLAAILFPLFLLFILFSPEVHAVEKSPQWFSFEFKVGEFIPTNDIVEDGLSKCCNERFELEFGFLYKSKFGVELGVGFLMENRTAVGAITNEESRDRFNFMLVPIQTNFTFRADFKEDQLVVPYVKAGPDFVIFRENVQGNVTSGVKYGLHGTAGIQILLEFWGEGEDLEVKGVNDVYFTIEGEYAWVNSFGGSGLDLSGFTVSGGFLFEF